MTLGVRSQKAGERYNVCSTADFGLTTYTQTPNSDQWHQARAAYLVAFTQGDNGINAASASNERCIVKGEYVKPGVSASVFQETLVRCVYVMKANQTGVWFGFCTRLSANANWLAPSVAASFYLSDNKLRLAVSDEGIPSDTYVPYMYKGVASAGYVSLLYTSGTVGNYDKTNYNTYEFRLYLMKGSSSTKCRLEMYINGTMMVQSTFLVDTILDLIKYFEEEIRLFVYLGPTNSVYMYYAGVQKN